MFGFTVARLLVPTSPPLGEKWAAPVHKALFLGRYQARQLKIIRHAGREALDVIGRATLDASERRLALIAGEWYPRPSGSAKLGNAELRLIRNVQNNCGWPSLLVSVERAPLTLRWPCRT